MYLERKFVCERLGISNWSSLQLLRATSIHLLRDSDVLRLLNRSRRGREEEFTYIPSDFITPEQASEETGIPVHKLLRWTRRRVKVPPHVRLTERITRFRRASLNKWLEARTK